MRHNPANTNCDKTQYGNADGVLCTCDVDDIADVAVASTVMPRALDPLLAAVTLTGAKATAYREWLDAARELDAAKAMLQPAEARWRAAMERMHVEMLR